MNNILKNAHGKDPCALSLNFLFVSESASHFTIQMIAVFNFRNFHCDTQ